MLSNTITAVPGPLGENEAETLAMLSATANASAPKWYLATSGSIPQEYMLRA
uniref:hypothetical protein n=1 Tax=Enterobacteriaceae TaxID=543 RepID=UPI00167F2408|nr:MULTISPECIES: hypothetical protein [Enterobacteriaceae]URQ56941.1 Hypothetical protein [Raoultella planticola]UUW41350.1 hypothetical protein [Leclercia sp. 29361]